VMLSLVVWWKQLEIVSSLVFPFMK
jgi:hypothetical protein